MHLIWYWLGFLPSICLPITAFALSLIYLHRRKRDNLPPGPFAWPVLGNLLSLRSNSTAALKEIRRTYGDVYSLYFGSRLVVVVNGKAVEECLSTRSAKFSMRPELFTAQYVLGGKSFAFSHMDVETHRRYRKLAVGVVKELLVSTHERSQPTTKEEINPISPQSIEDQIYAQAKRLCVGLFDIYASNSKSGQLDIRKEIMRRISFEMCGLASETILGKKLWEHELADLSELVEDLRNSNDATLILNFI
uniref:Uncharacterized protein n=1 Tax=Ciona savignyi TaxID=51511 RepID=H2ZAF9_CIOSA